MKFIDKDLTNELVKDAQQRLLKAKDYNSDPIVRDEIRKIYNGCCAYCESSFEEGAYFQIEHFYPKGLKKYKLLSKDIRNLHYSCQRCNNLKGIKNQEILSPNWFLYNGNWVLTRKEKISQEIYYVGHMLYSRNTSDGSVDRGRNTIELFNLNNDNIKIRNNRSFLVESRLRTLNNVYNQLKCIKNLLSNYDILPCEINESIEILFNQVIYAVQPNAHYSTMIIQNYGDIIIKLLRIYVQIKK